MSLIQDLANSTTPAESLNDIRIYPNPADEILYLESTSLIDSIILYSSTGKQVMQKTEPVKSVPVGQLQSGLYFLKVIMAGRKSEVVKFVKR